MGAGPARVQPAGRLLEGVVRDPREQLRWGRLEWGRGHGIVCAALRHASEQRPADRDRNAESEAEDRHPRRERRPAPARDPSAGLAARRTEPEPEQVAEETPPPEPEPAPAPEPEVDLQAVAREQAQAALLPFTEDLASLADSDVLETVADSRPLTASVGEAQRNERSMITSSVGTASGGINTASMSRNTGGTGLSARTVTEVESPVESVGEAAGGARRTGTSAGRAARSTASTSLSSHSALTGFSGSVKSSLICVSTSAPTIHTPLPIERNRTSARRRRPS